MELGLSIIGVIIGLCLFMFLIYKGMHGTIAAPISALVIAVFSGLELPSAILSTFASGWATTVKSVCFIFVLSSALAKVLTETGAAYTIAEFLAKILGVKRSIWIIYLGTYILQIGGFGLGAFLTMFPIGMTLCEKANYNKSIVAATVIAGGYVFGMTGPFTPATQNIICMQFFGTSSYAGLIPGLACSVFMLVAGCLYLDWQAKRWQKNGRGFQSQEEMAAIERQLAEVSRPSLIVSIAPIITVMVLFNAVGLAIEVAMFLGIVVGVVLMWKSFSPEKWFSILNQGVTSGAVPLIGISVVAGFGAVVSATPFYSWISDLLKNMSMHPFVTIGIIGLLCGVALGSNVSAVILATSSLGPVLQGFIDLGYNAGSMHRILIMSAGILDSLPHNGFMVALMNSFGTTYKESYFPVFVSTVIIPLIGVACLLIPLSCLGL